MNTIEILMAEVQRLRALLHDQNTTIGQTLAAAMGCYPHAPDEDSNEDPTAPYVVEPAIAEDVTVRAAEMIGKLRADLLDMTRTAAMHEHMHHEVAAENETLRAGFVAEREAALRAHDLLIAEREAARLTLAAEQGRQEGAPSEGWEYGVIDEEGGFGWRKKTADGMIFAWGRGVLPGINGGPDEPHPGGWARWIANEDGDLDDVIAECRNEAWGSRAAMQAADKAQEPR